MTIIIPAYKPDEKLLILLKQLAAEGDADLIVVNDGSGKEYEPVFERVKQQNCTLLIHPENRGKGAALKTAFRYLIEKGVTNEAICTADADGQHLAKDIYACLREAREHPDSMVIGTRDFGKGTPLRSRFGNWCSRVTFRLLIGTAVYDTQTGLRAFSETLLPLLSKIPGDRYEYEMQMLCDVCKEKIPVREVPISTVYIEENKSSHFHPLRDSMRVYRLLLKNAGGTLWQALSFAFSSAVAFLIDLAVDFLFYALLFRHLFDQSTAVLLSLLVARVVSSVVNYAVNRRLVFRSGGAVAGTFLRYALLAVGVYFGNFYLDRFFFVAVFSSALAFKPVALVLAELICFPASFVIQKYLIFPKKS